jgi:hypothetical protein
MLLLQEPTREFAAAAFVTTAAQYATVEFAFGGLQWAFALTLLPVAALALAAAVLKVREQAFATGVPVHS